MVNYEWVQQNSREFNSSENVHFFWVPISSLYLFQFSFYHFNLLKTLKFSQQKERLVSCCIANFIPIGVFDMEYLISISKYTCNCTAFLKYKYFTMMLGWDRSWSGAILVWGIFLLEVLIPLPPLSHSDDEIMTQRWVTIFVVCAGFRIGILQYAYSIRFSANSMVKFSIMSS